MANSKPIGVAYADPDLDSLSLGGTLVTSTAAELNKLDGATWTTDQLQQIADSFGTVDFDRSVKVARVALGVADTGGGVFAWQNPEAESILVHRVVVNVTTKSTGASTVNIGSTATDATTSSDNLIDGADFGTAIGVFDNIDDQGTNGLSKVLVAAGKWVTASRASGACAGLAGFAYIHYTVL